MDAMHEHLMSELSQHGFELLDTGGNKREVIRPAKEDQQRLTKPKAKSTSNP